MATYDRDLRTVMNSISSETFQRQANAYFNGGGQVMYDPVHHSYYEAKPLHNNISAPGTIYINATDVATTARVRDISQNDAAKAMLIHEMGHAFNATADLSAYTGTVEGKLAWCIRREAESATFAFRVASEMHAQSEFTTPIVLGPPLYKQDMYSKMAAAVAGISPNSFQYEAALMSFATQVYGADPKYKQFCMDWINKGGLPPAYLPPIDMNPGGSSGGGGGGGGGGSGSPRVPGGYWQEPDPNDIPQHPSNLTDSAPTNSAIDMSFLPESQNVDALVKQLSTAGSRAETGVGAANTTRSAELPAALAITGNQTHTASEDAGVVVTSEADAHIRIVGLYGSDDLHTHPTY